MRLAVLVACVATLVACQPAKPICRGCGMLDDRTASGGRYGTPLGQYRVVAARS